MATLPLPAAGRRATWHRYLIDGLLAVIVVLGTLVGADENAAMMVSPPTTLVQCLIFVSAGAAFFARRSPYLALAVASALDAAPYWLPLGGAGYHLSVMIALYAVVAYRPSRRSLPVAGSVVALQVGLMAWDMDWRWLSMFVALAALTTIVPIALGSAARSRTLVAEAMEQRARAAEHSRTADALKLVLEDRLRTARDLHDTVAHQIAVMSLNAGVASQALHTRPAEAETALATIREASRGVIASISELLAELREGKEERVGALHRFADVRELVEEFARLSPALSFTLDVPAHQSSHVGDVIYNVVREAMTNAYKHGDRDAPVQLELHVDAMSSRVLVTNSRREGQSDTSSGFGLTGMQERVAAAGGHLTVERSFRTFTLEACVPHSRADDL